jgi:hypothetical protein
MSGNINTDLTIDTTDIAPYRYKTDPLQPSSRLSPGGAANAHGLISATTKIGELIRSTASRRGQLSPNTSVNSTIVEESFRSVSTTHQSIIFAQSSSRTLGELVNEAPSSANRPKEYPVVVQKSTDGVISPRSGYQTSSGSYEYANHFEGNGNGYFVEQPEDEGDASGREIKLSIDESSNRTQANFPSKRFVSRCCCVEGGV